MQKPDSMYQCEMEALADPNADLNLGHIDGAEEIQE